MTRRMVQDIGLGGGIVSDIKPHLLPSAAWSGGRNIRFEGQRIFNMEGVQPLFQSAKTGLLWMGFANSTQGSAYLYATPTDVFAYDGVDDIEITNIGGDYSLTEDALWDLHMFNGFAILNNGAEVPQSWDPSTLANTLEDLANWDIGWRARTLVPFKTFLVALDVTKAGIRFDSMIKWSSAATPGNLPASWDHTDPTLEAGEASLPDTEYGGLVNGRILGDRLLLYKEQSIWSLTYVGGIDIFRPETIETGVGLTLRRSLATLPAARLGGSRSYPRHFFAGEDAFYLCDGANVDPVLDEIFKNEFLANVNLEFIQRSFSVVDSKRQELWFCFPEQGAETCTIAFIWNYRNNSHTFRELGGCLSIGAGLNLAPDATAVNVDLPFDDGTLFSDGVGFFDSEDLIQRFTMVEASVDEEQLFFLDLGETSYDGTTPFPCHIERLACPSTGTEGGQFYVDYNIRKLVSHIIPKFYSGACQVEVGVAENEDPASVVWFPAIDIDSNLFRADLAEPVSGRFISFRFSSDASQGMELAGFDYDVQLLGEW